MTKFCSKIRLPLFHLVKRERMGLIPAMLIRLCAFLLGMLTCGLLASILIEKLSSI